VRPPPGLEPRRFSDFDKELLERARTWIPSWGLADGERDFGRALLEVAARFSSEVAERLDQAGGKMARGFLDWLAVRGEAARPARMPVVFKLADTAREPVDAPHPVKMQVDAHGTNVTFETETDVRLVPGRLEIVVGVDPAADAFFLPPPGLSSLDPLEPLPTRWLLKSFAAPGSTVLQFDPGMGLQEGMLVEIAGSQYLITGPKGDLATIDPQVPAGEGFDVGTLVTKVETFDPFARARNRQEHVLYLGHADLLNIEAQATIDVVGAQDLGSGVIWEYWGKAKDASAADADPRWRKLDPAPAVPLKPNTQVLKKLKGSIEPRMIGTAQSRWIRARKAHLDDPKPSLNVDEITLRINYVPPPPATADPTSTEEAAPDPALLPPLEMVVNATPAPAGDFYPLGREPRMFDALYLGCAEAFSKQGAMAKVHFDLADPNFTAMAAIKAGLIGNVLAGVDKAGALHLLAINPDGSLTRLRDREPLRPGAGNTSAAPLKLSSSKFRPVMWMVGNDLHVAVVADSQVWVWIENQATPSSSKWDDSLQGPPSTSNPPSNVEGLVAISDSVSGGMMLVALRDHRLFTRTVPTGTTWDLLPAVDGGGTALEVEAIAQVRHENPAMLLSNYLLAVAIGSTPTDHDLFAVSSNLPAIALLTAIALDVAPFAVERISGLIEAAAVKEGAPRTLRATQSTSSTMVTGDLDANHTIADAALDGHVSSGQFVVYCVSRSTAVNAGPSDLLTWMPFDPETADPNALNPNSVVFSIQSDPSVGSPAGGITLFDPFLAPLAYMPGSRSGEVLVAELTGPQIRLYALATDFRSALAVHYPVPAVNTGDTIAPDVAGRPQPAIIDVTPPVNGRGNYANVSFIWLDRWLDTSNANASIPVYATSSAAIHSGTVSTTTKLQLDASDLLTSVDLPWLLVDDGVVASTARKIVGVVSVTSGGLATVDAPLPAVPGTIVSYWRPRSPISGTVYPALQLNASNNTWNISALDRGDLYFPTLDPKRQHVIAEVDLAGTPQWLAFDSSWNLTALPSGNIRFMVDATLTRWVQLLGDTSSNPALAWEYWNGTGWWRLDLKSNDTHNLKNSGNVTFEVPNDLKPVDWAGKTNHWIRARLIGGDFGQETVVVKTVPTVPPDPPGTQQVVVRSTSGIQPPYALNVWVTYSIEQEVPPTFLLTQDSGTLRDQSDANRMPDAKIEVFTPLIYALRRLDAAPGAASGTADACVPACECPSGTASTVPATNVTAPTPSLAPTATVSGSRTDRRALYLGFDSKLSGEPVNILLVVAEERAYDAGAPLNVDALVGDHFVPVVAQDNTRAIGETGVVSMSFSVEPISAELFGQTLSWLRLTPASATIDWKPALRGVYLNAVWAHAAETMTRELVGSSEGAPYLTLQLARPPLLKDSLELRVKEPLGTEERDDLLENDPNLVKSGVTDLPGDWVLWTQVADPVDHEASARVYSLDEDTGVIRFGDGQHGAIPPIGVDTIVAFKYERTEPATADGVAANFVGARSPLNLVTPVENAEAAVAADQAAGGVAPESGERVLHFGSAKLRHRGRAVTVRDFEDLALERFADVVQARCYIRGGNVRLVAVMRGANPSPSQAQRRELKRVLLAAAPAALAGSIRIESATVRRFRVELTLRVATLDVAGELARHVKQTLRTFFDTDTGGNGRDGWALGASPGEDDIAEALLDEPYLESVVSVVLSEIDAAGTEHPWPQTIKTTDLAMLASDGIRIAFEIAEAAA
jgi:hypothetical protein